MKNKIFYFDFQYFPEISYESYILKFFVDGKDLCELKNEKYKYDKLGDIYFIAYRLKSGKSLEKILTIPFPYDELKVKKEKKFTAVELVEKIDKRYEEKGYDVDIEEVSILNDWCYNHCLPPVGPGKTANVYFNLVDDKIEISWMNDEYFKYQKGVYYIPKKTFKNEVLKFIKIMFERREIVERKLNLVVINGKKISAKRNYDTEMEFEDQMLEELKNVNYNLKTVYELIFMTEKDRIIVPVILKYIKLTNNIYDKANLIRYLGIKGLFEVLPDLEEQLKIEKNLDIRAAILNTISVIKKYLVK